MSQVHGQQRLWEFLEFIATGCCERRLGVPIRERRWQGFVQCRRVQLQTAASCGVHDLFAVKFYERRGWELDGSGNIGGQNKRMSFAESVVGFGTRSLWEGFLIPGNPGRLFLGWFRVFLGS